jgi:hypothetical protein
MRCARRKGYAKVAQLVEHAPEKCGVGSSILPLGTIQKARSRLEGEISRVSGRDGTLLAKRAVEKLDRATPGRFRMLGIVVA